MCCNVWGEFVLKLVGFGQILPEFAQARAKMVRFRQLFGSIWSPVGPSSSKFGPTSATFVHSRPGVGPILSNFGRFRQNLAGMSSAIVWLDLAGMWRISPKHSMISSAVWLDLADNFANFGQTWIAFGHLWAVWPSLV